MNIYLVTWIVMAALGVIALTWQWSINQRTTGDFLLQLGTIMFVWFLMWGAGVFTLL